jgi:hypothetical protein
MTFIEKLRSAFAHPAPQNLPTVFVEPNDRGGWSLRWDETSKQFGNYATPQDAADVARLNFGKVEVVGRGAGAAPQPQLQTV